MFDLHLHSLYSDGDLPPAALASAVARRGLNGFALTDHNTIGGVNEAKEGAEEVGIDFLAGVEITSRWEQLHVHILGYARNFDENILEQALQPVLVGTRQQLKEMAQRAQTAGYKKVSWDLIATQWRQNPQAAYSWYQIAKQLQQHYGLSTAEARRMCVRGGELYVPYGDWVMKAEQAVAVVNEAGGIAVIAHPGIIEKEADMETMQRIVKSLVPAGLVGIEINHPVATDDVRSWLSKFAQERELLVTGGSDWHGPHRYHEKLFGAIGVTGPQWQAIADRLV